MSPGETWPTRRALFTENLNHLRSRTYKSRHSSRPGDHPLLLPSTDEVIPRSLHLPSCSLFWLHDEAFSCEANFEFLAVSTTAWGRAFAKQTTGWTCGFASAATLMRATRGINGCDTNTRGRPRRDSFSERALLKQLRANHPLNLSKCIEVLCDEAAGARAVRPGTLLFPETETELAAVLKAEIGSAGGVLVNLRPKNYLPAKHGGWGHWVLVVAVGRERGGPERATGKDKPSGGRYFAAILDPSESHPGGYWLELSMLQEAMATVDPDTGLNRGFVVHGGKGALS